MLLVRGMLCTVRNLKQDPIRYCSSTELSTKVWRSKGNCKALAKGQEHGESPSWGGGAEKGRGGVIVGRDEKGSSLGETRVQKWQPQSQGCDGKLALQKHPLSEKDWGGWSQKRKKPRIPA